MECNLETVVIQVTTSCPYSCPQCYMQKGEEFIAFDVAKQAMDISHRLGAKALQITGGEPILYPYLYPLIEYAYKKEMVSFLATSGFGHAKESYTALKEHGLTLICISLNDIDVQNNAKTRDGFHISLSAIQDAVAVGLTCYVNMVVSDATIDRLPRACSILRAMGVAGICVLRPFPSYDNRYTPTISQETMEILHQIVETNQSFIRVENCFREYWTYVRGVPFTCFDQGNHVVFVHADGTVSPCSKKMMFRYGSIQDMHTHRAEWIECICESNQ